MLRYHLLGTAVLTVALVAVAQGQGSVGTVDKETDKNPAISNEAEPVMDDDGGRVFIVRRNDANSIVGFRYHGGSVIAEPQQYNIFLGGAWLDPSLRRREAAFSGLLSQTEKGAEQATLDLYGVKNTFLPSENREQTFDFSKDQTLSDLQVERTLDEMLKTGAIQGPTANTVYVIFLPPGITSTLGSMIGGKHFAAYHNFFHREQGEVHYVVVPFEPEWKLAKGFAARALIEAAVNPAGDGWY